MGEKLQSSLVCLAAVAVAPVPGSSEMWFATTTMMWLDKDQAGQHVVYEHPRDTDPATVLTQFQCHSTKAHRALAAWFDMPLEKRRNCVLIHNASVRRVIVKSLIVNCIDGYGGSTLDWTSALDNHPLGSVMKKAMAMGASSTGNQDQDKVVIGAQRLAVVRLPTKPDTNWGWRGLFSYGDVKVGECALREDGIFSFICADCGLRVGDREGDLRAEQRLVGADDQLKRTASSNRELAAEDDAFPKPSLRRPTFITDARESKIVEDPKLGSEPKADVEVINSTEEPVQVKIFELGAAGSHSTRFFRSALAEATISGGQGRIFMVKATPGPNSEEAAFEVEIRIGSKKAKCEVVGGQVIFVDGLVD